MPNNVAVTGTYDANGHLLPPPTLMPVILSPHNQDGYPSEFNGTNPHQGQQMIAPQMPNPSMEAQISQHQEYQQGYGQQYYMAPMPPQLPQYAVPQGGIPEGYPENYPSNYSGAYPGNYPGVPQQNSNQQQAPNRLIGMG